MATLKDKYIELTKTRVANIKDTIPIELAFHCLLGQAFKNYKIKFGSEQKDVRFSAVLILPPRTGKGQITKIMKACADELLLSHVKIVAGSSDAGLVGSIDSEAHAHNVKHNLNIEDENYRDPVVMGDLGRYDMLLFEESKHLISAGKHTEQLLSILQEALDTPGIIRKKLAHSVPIEYETTASIWATTYYLDKIQDVLTEQGFFHRVAIYQRDYTITESLELRNKIVDLYKNSDSDINIKYEKLKNEICNEIRKRMTNEEVVLQLESSAIDKVKEFLQKFHETVSEYSGSELMVLLSFSQTIMDLSIKLASHYAILNGQKRISVVHIVQGYRILKSCVDTWLNKLKIGTEAQRGLTVRQTEQRKYQSFCVLLSKHDNLYFTKTQLLDKARVHFKSGQNSAMAIIEDMVSKNYLSKEKGEKNTHMYKPIRY